MRNLFFLFFALFLQGCAKQQSLSSVPEDKIDFDQLERIPLNEISDSLLGGKKYILLDMHDEELLFGAIHKVLCKNNRIYILDRKFNKLVVFDMKGQGIGKVGTFGQGPGEYLDIADFDVAEDGKIYCIDGQLDKLFSYSPDLIFLSATSLPFDADILQTLETGFLFGLSSWNHKKGKGSKVVLVDEEINILKEYLQYDDFFDPNYWLSFYQFVKTESHIVYNQPIDNHVYLFNHSGELEKSINIDFGDKNVLDEDKKDIERNIEKFDNYCLLRDFVVVTDRMIGGALWDGRQHKVFLHDMENMKCYNSEVVLDSDMSWGTGYSNGNWITYIDPDSDLSKYKSLPDSVRHHLGKEGFVLCLQILH
ncbi:6-bladed beta-propeller [Bacteroides zhangwenhongii]|uniref:6-bladed beta-propeller n=1 Tax=Bacteroides zhangwenhongii TaxID=2650157 RepID=A0ABT5H3I9_9BACE|nr:6-bladed beta-propeller [Bacteroides zhangwenhongii]MDC7135154.1 6-bladed beta-propeller [Bacteroides zhangwenhongii]OKZ25197.1 MAG: 6-bladed beta-propeller [Bacteroides finegoldii]